MKHWITLTFLSVVAMIGSVAVAAEPQRVAVVNPAKVFSDIQERKDLQEKIDSDVKLYEGMMREKREKAGQLKAAMDALKPGTPQYNEKKQQFVQADIELAVWAKSTQTNLEQDRKTQLRTLFQKIESTTAQVAKQKGYDLVLANQAEDIPDDVDRLTFDQLRAGLKSKNILYVNDKMDITLDVIALMDSQYRASSPTTAPSAK